MASLVTAEAINWYLCCYLVAVVGTVMLLSSVSAHSHPLITDLLTSLLPCFLTSSSINFGTHPLSFSVLIYLCTHFLSPSSVPICTSTLLGSSTPVRKVNVSTTHQRPCLAVRLTARPRPSWRPRPQSPESRRMCCHLPPTALPNHHPLIYLP